MPHSPITGLHRLLSQVPPLIQALRFVKLAVLSTTRLTATPVLGLQVRRRTDRAKPVRAVVVRAVSLGTGGRRGSRVVKPATRAAGVGDARLGRAAA